MARRTTKQLFFGPIIFFSKVFIILRQATKHADAVLTFSLGCSSSVLIFVDS